VSGICHDTDQNSFMSVCSLENCCNLFPKVLPDLHCNHTGIINSREENNFVMSKVRGNSWIEDRDFGMPHDRVSCNFFDWRPGEPNNYLNTNEDCIDSPIMAAILRMNHLPCFQSKFPI
jgi:hypothetical protein